jgi:uncharacterized protein (DUF849 family)
VGALGFEDSLYFGKGNLVESNVAQVHQIRQTVEGPAMRSQGLKKLAKYGSLKMPTRSPSNFGLRKT